MHVESTTGFACDFGGFGNLALGAPVTCPQNPFTGSYDKLV
jgi:hypothetical protein